MKKCLAYLILMCGAVATPFGSNNVHADIWAGNGHDYQLVIVTHNWADARAAAQAMGPGWDLATVTSAAEAQFLVDKILPATIGERTQYWIGGTDVATEGTFQWVTGEPFSFTDWWGGEPNGNTGENFIPLDFRGGSWHWNDASGDVQGFIAESNGSTAVPEPSSIALAGLGGLGLAIGAYRRRKMSAL